MSEKRKFVLPVVQKLVGIRLRYAVQSILVVIEIEPILTSSVVPIMPEIRALGPGLTATLSVDTVRVILYGPLPVLDSLTPTDVRVTLDLLGLESGTHNITPNVVVTATGLEVRSTQPAFVTVVITDAITTTLPTESMLRDTIRPVSARNVPAFNHWLTFPPVFLSILRNTVYTLYT